MDLSKRSRLIEELSKQAEPQLVPITQFLDGNDDVGSIGCNLLEHPGIEAFRKVFAELATCPDVKAIYAQIAELDPGDDCWPFSDTVFVVGSISADELKKILSPLEPDEVGTAQDFGAPESIAEHALAAWWD